MINIMLVAGDRTQSLSDYFKQRASLEVVQAYNNLSSYSTTIEHKIIKVDKLVYVYQDESINIRRDMELLKQLLKRDGFFTVKEIVFFIKVDSNTEKGLSYFKAVMEDANYENYKIEKSRKALTFVEIYDNLLGITQSANVRNSYQKVYRVERNSDTKAIYEPENDINIIEPFNYKKVEDYERSKDITRKTESGAIIEDDTDESNVNTKFNNPNLDHIEIEGIFERKNIFVLSGNSKSGKTTSTLALAVSATQAKKRVVIISLEDNKDIVNYMNYFKVNFTEFTSENLIINRKIGSENMINVVTLSELKEDLKLNCVKYMIENLHKFDTDLFIIETPKEYLKDTLILTGFKTNRVFYTTDFIEKEISKTAEVLDTSASGFKQLVLLSDVMNRMNCCKLITGVEAKEILGEHVSVIQPIMLTDFDISDNLYNITMEVIR